MEAFAADQKGHLLPRPTPAFRDWEVLQRHVVLKPSDTAVWRCSAGEEKVARAVLSVNSAHAKANGGAGGIRTLDTGLPYTHFPGVRLRPLGHCSAFLSGPPRFAFIETAIRRTRPQRSNREAIGLTRRRASSGAAGESQAAAEPGWSGRRFSWYKPVQRRCCADQASPANTVSKPPPAPSMCERGLLFCPGGWHPFFHD